MKKSTIFIHSVILSMIILTGCQSNTTAVENSDTISSSLSENDLNEPVNIESDSKAMTSSVIEINGFTFFTPYQDIIDTLGEPNSIIKIDDETVTILYGYYSLLIYDGIEIMINADDDFVLNDRSSVIEVDITNEDYKTSRGIGLGASLDEVKMVYDLDEGDFYASDSENPIPPSRISGLRRECVLFIDYSSYCYIQEYDSPIALIFLFDENNVVNRIELRHLTAG